MSKKPRGYNSPGQDLFLGEVNAESVPRTETNDFEGRSLTSSLEIKTLSQVVNTIVDLS